MSAVKTGGHLRFTREMAEAVHHEFMRLDQDDAVTDMLRALESISGDIEAQMTVLVAEDDPATRVGPDEFLVLSFRQTIHPAQLNSMRDDLKARFPDVADRILIVGGGAQMAVITADRKDSDG